MIETSKTVGRIAAESPAASAVLEALGIDYCCHGARGLAEACQAAGVTIGAARDALAAAVQAPPAAPARDWTAEPLDALIGHIRATHHAYTRWALARLAPLFDKVCAAHAPRHPELPAMRETFAALSQELALHLMKEEVILFPYVIRMEEAAMEKAPLPPAPFGTVQNPVAMMMREHDGAGEALASLRSASAGYTVPSDACASFRALYEALAALEADLHQHIHLENNILFPKAIALEQRL